MKHDTTVSYAYTHRHHLDNSCCNTDVVVIFVTMYLYDSPSHLEQTVYFPIDTFQPTTQDRCFRHTIRDLGSTCFDDPLCIRINCTIVSSSHVACMHMWYVRIAIRIYQWRQTRILLTRRLKITPIFCVFTTNSYPPMISISSMVCPDSVVPDTQS